MSDYIKATNFATKDTLSTGNPNKIIKGTEIDTEFNAIASAVASKSDINSPSFTGIPEAPTAAAGTNTTQVATTAHVFAERTNTSTLTNKTLTSPTINTPTINTPTINTPAISGGSISGITDLAVADGGTGSSTLAANSVLLGNGTSALQTVAPSTNGNFLRSNGTTWVSQAVTVGSGTVTSVATGNGLSGGTITTSGTLAIACPGFNTVGSYCFMGISYLTQGFTSGDNFSTGNGGMQVQSAAIQDLVSGNGGVAYTNNLSGTWKWMGSNVGAGNNAVVGCRVS